MHTFSKSRYKYILGSNPPTRLRNLRGNDWGLDDKITMITYNILVRSLFDYAPMAHLLLSDKSISKLEKIQRKAIPSAPNLVKSNKNWTSHQPNHQINWQLSSQRTQTQWSNQTSRPQLQPSHPSQSRSSSIPQIQTKTNHIRHPQAKRDNSIGNHPHRSNLSRNLVGAIQLERPRRLRKTTTGENTTHISHTTGYTSTYILLAIIHLNNNNKNIIIK